MEQTRLSVQQTFPTTSINPYVLYINGQAEWVDNYLKFGDLIEEYMGKDARDFYFENLYTLLTFAELGGYFIEDYETPHEEPVAQKEKKSERKSRKTVRAGSKRLF